MIKKLSELSKNDQAKINGIKKDIKRLGYCYYNYSLNEYVVSYLKRYYSVVDNSGMKLVHHRMDYIDTYDNEYVYNYTIKKRGR